MRDQSPPVSRTLQVTARPLRRPSICPSYSLCGQGTARSTESEYLILYLSLTYLPRLLLKKVENFPCSLMTTVPFVLFERVPGAPSARGMKKDSLSPAFRCRTWEPLIRLLTAFVTC